MKMSTNWKTIGMTQLNLKNDAIVNLVVSQEKCVDGVFKNYQILIACQNK